MRLGDGCIINPRNSFEDNKEASLYSMALINEGFCNKHTAETKLWGSEKWIYSFCRE